MKYTSFLVGSLLAGSLLSQPVSAGRRPLLRIEALGDTIPGGYYDPTKDPNFDPNNPATYPVYDPNDPKSKPWDPNNVPVIDPNTPSWQDNLGGFVKQQANNYADVVKTEAEKMVQQTEDDIMQGLTDLVEGWLMQQLASLLNTSPLRAVEKLKKTMKDAYSKLQRLNYQNMKIDLAEQKGNTELTDAFATYYKNLHLKEHAKAVDESIKASGDLLSLTLPADSPLSAPQSLFTTDEQQQLRDALGRYGDMSDMIQEIKIATNHSETTAYMAEADRMQVLDQTLSDIKTRYTNAERVRSQIKMVANRRLNDAGRLTIYQGLVGSPDQSGQRVTRAR